MSYTTVPIDPTDLTKEISEFSLVGVSGPIEEMGAPIDQEGTPQWNRGLSIGDANHAPFHDGSEATNFAPLITPPTAPPMAPPAKPAVPLTALAPNFVAPHPADNIIGKDII